MKPAVLAQRLAPFVSLMRCPRCQSAFELNGASLICENRHCYDLSRRGYVNLAPSHDQNTEKYDAELFDSRRLVFEHGFYQPVAEAIAGWLPNKPLTVLDAGCGEGYYTRAAAAALRDAGRLKQAVGTDISKAATRYAAGRDRSVRYVTANSYRLPVADGAADLILSLFAPAPAEEFLRVLSPRGLVIRAVPGADHLWELKQAVYDEPYRNREEKHRLAGFDERDRVRVEYPFALDSPGAIRDLFSMTPYAKRTPREGLDRLERLERLDVTFSFLLLVCGPSVLDS